VTTSDLPFWVGLDAAASYASLRAQPHPKQLANLHHSRGRYPLLPVNGATEPPKLPANGPGGNPLVYGSNGIHNLLFGHSFAASHSFGHHLREQAAWCACAGLGCVDGRIHRMRLMENWNGGRFQDSVTHSGASVAAPGLVNFPH